MKINDNLNRILKERGMNVPMLSRESDITHENIYKILQGKNKNPGVYTIKKIADSLELTVDELIK